MDAIDYYIKQYHELKPKLSEVETPCCKKPCVVLDTNTELHYCKNCGTQLDEFNLPQPYVQHQHVYSRISYFKTLLSNLMKNRTIDIDNHKFHLIQEEVKDNITIENIKLAIRKLKIRNLNTLHYIIYAKLTNTKFNITSKEKRNILYLYSIFDNMYQAKLKKSSHRKKRHKFFINYCIILRAIFNKINRPDLCIFVRNVNKKKKIKYVEKTINSLKLIN